MAKYERGDFDELGLYQTLIIDLRGPRNIRVTLKNGEEQVIIADDLNLKGGGEGMYETTFDIEGVKGPLGKPKALEVWYSEKVNFYYHAPTGTLCDQGGMQFLLEMER